MKPKLKVLILKSIRMMWSSFSYYHITLKVHHQSETSMDWWEKNNVVMHLAHAQQTQSTSVLVKLSVRNLKKKKLAGAKPNRICLF